MIRRRLLFIGLALVVLVGAAGYVLLRRWNGSSIRNQYLGEWFRDPQGHPDWAVEIGQRCGDAPFQMPTNGYIGYLWGDSFRPGHSHQGIDIFAGTPPGEVEVRTAYDGYLTRLPDWKSSLIVRIPSDPLQPGRQIWTYYTHLAEADGTSLIDAAFPPGTSEVFVPAGTLLGRQGNYSGTVGSPTGVHLHFSIVQDDGRGKFRNELEIQNTLDPSPYLGLSLNARLNKDIIPVCR
jgi:hypothetical protein